MNSVDYKLFVTTEKGPKSLGRKIFNLNNTITTETTIKIEKVKKIICKQYNNENKTNYKPENSMIILIGKVLPDDWELCLKTSTTFFIFFDQKL